MKNNKKGFTLVELLAVIVILAIIALIATPIILNVIDNAKEGSAKNSAYGYIDAVEKANAQQILKESNISVLSGTYTIGEKGATVIESKAGEGTKASFAVSFKGTAPTAGTLTYADGKLKSGEITVDGKTFTITDGTLDIKTK